jgi:hypothetical protein
MISPFFGEQYAKQVFSPYPYIYAVFNKYAIGA